MIIKLDDILSAQKLLGLEGYPLQEGSIKDAYRKLAKLHHPDAGGDPAQFAAIDRAKHLLLEQLKRTEALKPREVLQKADCPNCKGMGRVVIRRGFGRMTITCGRCKGSGDANWDEDIMDT